MQKHETEFLSRSVKMEGFQAALRDNMRKLREQNLLLDTEIICIDGIVRAHGVVLATGSNYFRRELVTRPQNKNTITVPFAKKEDVEKWVDFLYGTDRRIEHHKILSAVKTARELQILNISWPSVELNIRRRIEIFNRAESNRRNEPTADDRMEPDASIYPENFVSDLANSRRSQGSPDRRAFEKQKSPVYPMNQNRDRSHSPRTWRNQEDRSFPDSNKRIKADPSYEDNLSWNHDLDFIDDSSKSPAGQNELTNTTIEGANNANSQSRKQNSLIGSSSNVSASSFGKSQNPSNSNFKPHNENIGSQDLKEGFWRKEKEAIKSIKTRGTSEKECRTEKGHAPTPAPSIHSLHSATTVLNEYEVTRRQILEKELIKEEPNHLREIERMGAEERIRNWLGIKPPKDEEKKGTPNDIQTQKKQKGRITCNTCNKSFKGQQSLKQHIYRYHELKNKVKCGKCERKFINDKNLVRHTMRFH